METTGTVGYAAMFEQFYPTDLLKWCKQAEESGFTSVMASDHFHPWTPEQGESAFVWSWLGALGATTSLRFGTGVTTPGLRYHPATLAQADATFVRPRPRSRRPPSPPTRPSSPGPPPRWRRCIRAVSGSGSGRARP